MSKYLFVMVACLAMMCVACGDDDDNNPSDSGTDTDTDSDTDSDTDTDTDSDTDTDTGSGELNLTAATADGPCGPGSVYFVAELDPDTFEALPPVSGSTDSLGRISGVTLKTETPYEMWVQCYDFNEIVGALSESQVTLRTFLVTGPGEAASDGGVIPDQPGNITDVSHFLSTYVKAAYIASGTHDHATFKAIQDGAFASLISQMSFLVAPSDLGGCDVNELNIVSGPSSCNDTTLAVELTVRNYAVKTADAEGQPQTAFLQTTLDGVRFAFEDGTLSTGAPDDLVAKIMASVSNLDVVSASSNLEGYLGDLGATAPNPNTVLDTDSDAHVNANDDDIDDDGVPNDINGDDIANTADCAAPTAPCEDEAPYDKMVGNGMYFDAANSLRWELVASEIIGTWADADTYCNGLMFGGYDDWRMPTYGELETLVSGCDEPPCPAYDGPGVDGCYWHPVLGGVCNDYWSTDLCLFYASSNMTTLPFTTVSENCLQPDVSAYIRCVRTP